LKLTRITIASTNSGKVREISAILEGAGLRTRGLDETGCVLEVEETGDGFEENARIKAMAWAGALGGVVLGEDSGLEVDALGGAPGVFSARFAGEPQDPASNNALLMERMNDVPEAGRTARYRCAVCLATLSGIVAEARGVTEGRIAETPRGTGGFGYDPFFVSDDLGVTFAEASPAEKHSVSHRGRALRALLAVLKEKGLL